MSKNYNSDNGFSVSIWGSMQWQFLHIISFNYPVNPTKEDKINYHNYIMSLKHVLPCSACRINYSKNLKDAGYNKSKLKNRDTFSKFIYDLHNAINLSLGKKKYKTFEEVRETYNHFRAKCTQLSTNSSKESGCILPVNNIKAQCVIHIIPMKPNQESFIIDKKCIPKKNKA